MNDLELSAIGLRRHYLLALAGLLLAGVAVIFVVFAIAINASRETSTEHPQISLQAAEHIALVKEPGKISKIPSKMARRDAEEFGGAGRNRTDA